MELHTPFSARDMRAYMSKGMSLTMPQCLKAPKWQSRSVLHSLKCFACRSERSISMLEFSGGLSSCRSEYPNSEANRAQLASDVPAHGHSRFLPRKLAWKLGTRPVNSSPRRISSAANSIGGGVHWLYSAMISVGRKPPARIAHTTGRSIESMSIFKRAKWGETFLAFSSAAIVRDSTYRCTS